MTERRENMPDETRRRRFEVRDVSATGLVIFGIGLMVVIFGVMVGLWFFYGEQMGVSPVSKDTSKQDWSYTEGHLVDILEDKARMQKEVAARIEQYGWIDREGGRARIPIERAMVLVARDGLPVWNPDAAPKTPLEMIYEKAAEQK